MSENDGISGQLVGAKYLIALRYNIQIQSPIMFGVPYCLEVPTRQKFRRVLLISTKLRLIVLFNHPCCFSPFFFFSF